MFISEGESNVDSQLPQAESGTPLEAEGGSSENATEAEGEKILDPVQACREEKKTLSEKMRGQKKKVQLALAGFVLMSTLGSGFFGAQRAEAGERKPEGTKAEERMDVINQQAKEFLRQVIKDHKESKGTYSQKKIGARDMMTLFIQTHGAGGVEALKGALQYPQISNDLKGPALETLLFLLQQYSPHK